MKIHELKTDPQAFQDVKHHGKNFEIRKDDRDYTVGDILLLKETKHSGLEMREATGKYPLIYTGEVIAVKVTFILSGPIYGLAEGWVIMAIQ